MASANERYVLDGHKTILLIDGLDHVMREVHLQTRVLHELPHPSEVPAGFLIIPEQSASSVACKRNSRSRGNDSRRRKETNRSGRLKP